MYQLYGDGIHDDTAAIQRLLDTKREILLPEPEKYYLISRPLEIGSYTRLVLPRFAEIRLADGLNCVMLRNKMVFDPAKRLPEGIYEGWNHFASYVNDYSPEEVTENIEIIGGIWNCNNMGQNPNPLQSHDFSVHEFWGYGMLFYNVKNFKIASMTLKDPTNFAITLDTVSYFTVEDIQFDFNYGNPYALNMDGIHLCGHSHYGVIRNLKGACYDDLVALNADEGSHGPITNIEIDGIFAEECHSAVRLLSLHNPVEKVHISNVFGTYYQYCIGISKYYPGTPDKGFDAISIDNIFASKAKRLPHLYPFPNSYVFPLIWISEAIVRNLKISSLHRREYNVPSATIYVGTDTVVDRLILEDITSENYTGENMPHFVNNGTIRQLLQRDIYEQ